MVGSAVGMGSRWALVGGVQRAKHTAERDEISDSSTSSLTVSAKGLKSVASADAVRALRSTVVPVPPTPTTIVLDDYPGSIRPGNRYDSRIQTHFDLDRGTYLYRLPTTSGFRYVKKTLVAMKPGSSTGTSCRSWVRNQGPHPLVLLQQVHLSSHHLQDHRHSLFAVSAWVTDAPGFSTRAPVTSPENTPDKNNIPMAAPMLHPSQCKKSGGRFLCSVGKVMT
ncbi:MAG: hypothetical protein CM1200mP22_23470 [Dehalococcoidia bacterium]|nr:MAG: hypothetical protein CM1200mP22_23470 [Dehalococcoidia bacterium]